MQASGTSERDCTDSKAAKSCVAQRTLLKHQRESRHVARDVPVRWHFASFSALAAPLEATTAIRVWQFRKVF